MKDKRILYFLICIFIIGSGIWYSNYNSMNEFTFSREKGSSELYEEDNISDFAQDDLKFIVNINEADIDVLIMLPGIGESIAKSIIEYREEYGRFESIDELKNVDRIGDKIFEELKDKIEI